MAKADQICQVKIGLYLKHKRLRWKELNESPSSLISYGYFEALKNYVSNYKREISNFFVDNIYGYLSYPILQNRLDIIEYVYEKFNKIYYFPNSILTTSIIHSRFEIVKYIIEQHLNGKHIVEKRHLEEAVHYSLLYGNIDGERIFVYLLNTLKIYIVPDAIIESAIKLNRLERIKILFDHGKMKCPQNATEIAASSGNFEFVKYFGQHYPETITSKALDIIAKSNQMELMITFKELAPKGVDFTTNAIDHVAMQGHLKLLKWLNENSTVGCTSQAMDWAAEKNHFEILKYLHLNRNEGCTTNAMNMACQSGHFEIVKWLHENRSEGCTKEAMNKAAIYGHLEIVKWLHENRTEGCSAKALEGAAKTNQLEVVKFLIENRTEGELTKRTLHSIGVAGHFEMFRYIVDNGLVNDRDGKGLIDDEMIESAIKRNYQDLLGYLLQHNTTYLCTNASVKYIIATGNIQCLKLLLDLGRLKKVKLDLTGAISNNHFDIIKFVYDNKIHVNRSSRPLYTAASERKLDILVYLIENNLCPTEIEDVTNLAVIDLDHHYARYLFEHSPTKPVINQNEIMAVIKKGHPDMLNLFIEYGIINENHSIINNKLNK